MNTYKAKITITRSVSFHGLEFYDCLAEYNGKAARFDNRYDADQWIRKQHVASLCEQMAAASKPCFATP